MMDTYQENYHGWVIVNIEGEDKLRGINQPLVIHSSLQM